MSSEYTEPVYIEVLRECSAQLEQWGEQNHPMLDPILLKRPGGCGPARMANEYEVPTETRARGLLERAAEKSELTYMHILLEEVCEAIACLDDEKAMRGELIQVAAVAISMVEAIDRQESLEAENDE